MSTRRVGPAGRPHSARRTFERGESTDTSSARKRAWLGRNFACSSSTSADTASTTAAVANERYLASTRPTQSIATMQTTAQAFIESSVFCSVPTRTGPAAKSCAVRRLRASHVSTQSTPCA